MNGHSKSLKQQKGHADFITLKNQATLQKCSGVAFSKFWCVYSAIIHTLFFAFLFFFFYTTRSQCNPDKAIHFMAHFSVGATRKASPDSTSKNWLESIMYRPASQETHITAPQKNSILNLKTEINQLLHVFGSKHTCHCVGLYCPLSE